MELVLFRLGKVEVCEKVSLVVIFELFLEICSVAKAQLALVDKSQWRLETFGNFFRHWLVRNDTVGCMGLVSPVSRPILLFDVFYLWEQRFDLVRYLERLDAFKEPEYKASAIVGQLWWEGLSVELDKFVLAELR